ncbi:hypothetical protein FACS1894147_06090 [Spirochaetia bacterium]|nr:hypothetical protein FACS1894147_06090 [Spirochaetia bacterium]
MFFFSGRGIRQIALVFGVVLALALGGYGFFTFRQPVVLVSDLSFSGLYGSFRGIRAQVELSLRFLRLFKVVNIAEDAGPDMVAFVLEESEKSPYAVLFPYRYYEGARRYADKFPQLPVLVMGGPGGAGGGTEGDSGGLELIGADTETDCYRAGLAAALLNRGKGGKVGFFHGGALDSADRDAFLAGLREGGAEDPPLYIEGNGGNAPWQELSSAVVRGTGGAQMLLERNLDIPVVLFSWVDPELTPRTVKVVFDDSPWALAVRVLENKGRKGEARKESSGVIVLSGRIGDPGLARALKKAVKIVL